MIHARKVWRVFTYACGLESRSSLMWVVRAVLRMGTVHRGFKYTVIPASVMREEEVIWGQNQSKVDSSAFEKLMVKFRAQRRSWKEEQGPCSWQSHRTLTNTVVKKAGPTQSIRK